MNQSQLKPAKIKIKSARIQITFRGWPGHYILARRCDFRLNTLIEYKRIKIVVSTVGLLQEWHKDGATPFQPKGYETIGCGRAYETMVFRAKLFQPKYYDADVSKRIHIESKWSHPTWDKPDDDLAANKMHHDVINEISTKLLNGTKLK